MKILLSQYKAMSDDQEIDIFFKQLDSEKRTGKNILFVQTDYQLESAVSFSQYIFKNDRKYTCGRLITLIGELHDQPFSCQSPTPTHTLSIADYCKMAVERNPRCRVMLEYNKGDDATRIGSETIRTTFVTLQRAGKDNQIIPFDTRGFFLTPRGQNDLYGTGYSKYKTYHSVEMAFIEPFYAKLREDPHLFDLSGTYDPNIVEYLLRQYFPDIKLSFEYIVTKLHRGATLKSIKQLLKDTWKKVTDYYVLGEILRNDDIDEYIIITGESHRENIQKVVAPFLTQLNNQSGSKGNCVKLFQTYLI